MRAPLLFLLGSFLLTPAFAQNRGLLTSASQATPTWQARLERDPLPLLSSRADTPLWLLAAPPQSLRLLGDYQFSTLRLGQTGGLRLTGGVMLNVRRTGQTTDWAVPSGALSGQGYAGVGYASGGVSRLGLWGFSADLGLTALGFGSDRVSQRRLGLDPNGPDLRPQPLLRLGMQLAF